MQNWVTSKIRIGESVRNLFFFVLASLISFTKADVTGEKGDGAARAYSLGFSEHLVPKQRGQKMLLKFLAGTEDYVYTHKPISFLLLPNFF